jgi:hypothetical protein
MGGLYLVGKFWKEKEQVNQGLNQPTYRLRYVFFQFVCYHYVFGIMFLLLLLLCCYRYYVVGVYS